MTLLESIDEIKVRLPRLASTGDRNVLEEESFLRVLVIERKRTERSGRPFLLALLEAGNRQRSENNEKILEAIASALLSSTRDTDAVGWFKNSTTIGAIFSGLVIDDKSVVLSAILTRISVTLRKKLTPDQFDQVSLSFHFYPDEWDHELSGRPSDKTLYPDLLSREKDRESLIRLKRVTDIVGSTLALIISLPLIIIIAVAIKTSSRGPVLFKQRRVGQYGECFTFLKFRSMQINNDSSAHQEYVKKLIAGEAQREPASGQSEGVYKLTHDKRVTLLGRILRKSSLDELPQFLNVLRGDMSLVGPRPAIPYEVASYQTWHRCRVLDVKPGITGLWQVRGRNRLRFDEMVRLDLQYAKMWSPWLDLKILLLTPRAVFKGAY